MNEIQSWTDNSLPNRNLQWNELVSWWNDIGFRATVRYFDSPVGQDDSSRMDIKPSYEDSRLIIPDDYCIDLRPFNPYIVKIKMKNRITTQIYTIDISGNYFVISDFYSHIYIHEFNYMQLMNYAYQWQDQPFDWAGAMVYDNSSAQQDENKLNINETKNFASQYAVPNYHITINGQQRRLNAWGNQSSATTSDDGNYIFNNKPTYMAQKNYNEFAYLPYVPLFICTDLQAHAAEITYSVSGSNVNIYLAGALKYTLPNDGDAKVAIGDIYFDTDVYQSDDGTVDQIHWHWKSNVHSDSIGFYLREYWRIVISNPRINWGGIGGLSLNSQDLDVLNLAHSLSVPTTRDTISLGNTSAPSSVLTSSTTYNRTPTSYWRWGGFIMNDINEHSAVYENVQLKVNRLQLNINALNYQAKPWIHLVDAVSASTGSSGSTDQEVLTSVLIPDLPSSQRIYWQDKEQVYVNNATMTKPFYIDNIVSYCPTSFGYGARREATYYWSTPGAANYHNFHWYIRSYVVKRNERILPHRKIVCLLVKNPQNYSFSPSVFTSSTTVTVLGDGQNNYTYSGEEAPLSVYAITRTFGNLTIRAIQIIWADSSTTTYSYSNSTSWQEYPITCWHQNTCQGLASFTP